MMDRQTQVFADGKNLVIIFDQGKGIQFSYEIKDPIVTSIQTVFGNQLDPIYMMSSRTKVINFEPYHQNIAVNIDLVTSDMTNKEGKNLLMNLDMFKNIKVSELFGIINRKLKEREKQ